MAHASIIGEIVAGLKSVDWEEQDAAAKRLQRLREGGLSFEDGRQALVAATEEFPPRQSSWGDSAADLVMATCRKPLVDYVPLVIELFPRFNERAREQALWLLSDIEERDATLAYVHLLRIHAAAGLVTKLPIFCLQSKPRHPEVLFPELLKFTIYPKLAVDICWLCLDYCRAGLLEPTTLAPWLEAVLAIYIERRDALLPAQQGAGIAWMWEEDYRPLRQEAAILLDLLGYFSNRESELELRRALDYRDPVLKLYAVVSLVRQGRDVDPVDVAEVAAAAEVRGRLWDFLVGMDRHSLYPEKYSNQSALAESAMVQWLTIFTELDGVPDEIELMKIVAVDSGTEGGWLDYYVFRFRTFPPHWAAESGWMAGVAGPYLRAETPTTKAWGYTFSSFAPWSSATAEEHVRQLREATEPFLEHRDG